MTDVRDGRHPYPLFCVDNGNPVEEHRYRGPFDTESAALSHAGTFGGRVRRCRRVCPTELKVAPSAMMEHLHQDLEGSANYFPAEPWWADWGDVLVEQVEDAESKLLSLVRSCFRVRVFICEGDEPTPVEPRSSVGNYPDDEGDRHAD